MERRLSLLFISFSLLILSLIVSVRGVEQSPFHPQADPRSLLVLGNARFTILTSKLIRYKISF